MLPRTAAAGLLLAGLLVPPAAYGQAVEEDEAEAVQSTAKFSKQEKPPELSQVAKLIVQQTNGFRKEEGHPRVEVNPKLTETAEDFASYMSRTNKYGHTADGNRPADRAKRHGYDYCLISENIAYQYSSAGFTTGDLAKRLYEGWKQSPGHRKNMLDPDVTETGVAVSQSEETGYYYAVQLFGRPQSAASEFQVVNQSDALVEYQVGDRAFPLPPRYTRTHTRCRPADLTFRWPDGKEAAQTVRTDHGDRFVIVTEQGEFRLKKE